MIEKLKQWIIKRFFVTIAMDSFRKAHDDIMVSMEDDIERKVNVLAEEKLSGLLSVVDLSKVVTMDKQKGVLFVGGERLDDNRLVSLKSEADFLLKSDIWALLYETPKELAQKAMFVSGESLADMQKGKSILYTLSAQKNILDVFNSYQPKK